MTKPCVVVDKLGKETETEHEGKRITLGTGLLVGTWEGDQKEKRGLKGSNGQNKNGVCFSFLFGKELDWSFDGFGGEGVRMKRENGYIHKDLAAYLWNCFPPLFFCSKCVFLSSVTTTGNVW